MLDRLIICPNMKDINTHKFILAIGFLNICKTKKINVSTFISKLKVGIKITQNYLQQLVSVLKQTKKVHPCFVGL